MATTQIQTASLVSQMVEAITESSDRITRIGYGLGETGLVLFYSYLARYTGKSTYVKLAHRWFEHVVEAIDPKKYQGMASIFYRELSELGMVILFLNRHNLLHIDADQMLIKLDRMLEGFMYRKIEEGDLCLMSGALAAGHYFMYRLDTLPEAEQYLKDLVTGIRKNAKQNEQGYFYWRWPLVKSEGIFLNTECGSAMVISFLTALYQKGIYNHQSLLTIRSAVDYVMSHQRNNPESLFPILVGEAEQLRSLRCGDLSTCYGLLRGAQVLQDRLLTKKVLHMLHLCCQRKSRQTALIPDAGLSYGAAGTAVVYDRLHQLTDDSRLGEAASHWYQKILSYQEYENEFLGFRARFNQKHLATNVAFNEGIVGIAIALMQYEDRSLPSVAPLLGFI